MFTSTVGAVGRVKLWFLDPTWDEITESSAWRLEHVRVRHRACQDNLLGEREKKGVTFCAAWPRDPARPRFGTTTMSQPHRCHVPTHPAAACLVGAPRACTTSPLNQLTGGRWLTCLHQRCVARRPVVGMEYLLGAGSGNNSLSVCLAGWLAGWGNRQQPAQRCRQTADRLRFYLNWLAAAGWLAGFWLALAGWLAAGPPGRRPAGRPTGVLEYWSDCSWQWPATHGSWRGCSTRLHLVQPLSVAPCSTSQSTGWPQLI